MPIWRIGTATRYRGLGYLHATDSRNAPRFVGKSVSNNWVPYEVVLDEEEGLDSGADFLRFSSGGVIACNQRGKDAVYPLVKEEVEFLPLTHSIEPYYVVNVVKTYPCFDYERSEVTCFPSGNLKGVGKIALKPDCNGKSPIFKIEEFLLSMIFVTDVVKQTVEDYKLQGLTFEQVVQRI